MMLRCLRALFAVSLLVAPALTQVRVGVRLGPVNVSANLGGVCVTGPRLVPPGYSTCAPRGYYKWVDERVWCPGYWEDVQVPAEYGWRIDSCGRRIWVVIRPATCERRWHEGYWKYERRRVWVGR